MKWGPKCWLVTKINYTVQFLEKIHFISSLLHVQVITPLRDR